MDLYIDNFQKRTFAPSRSTFLHYRPQRSWGKVIFSDVCVKNSVHRGEKTPPFRSRQPPSPRGTVCAGRYGQQAGGTNPTGMQSCFHAVCRKIWPKNKLVFPTILWLAPPSGKSQICCGQVCIKFLQLAFNHFMKLSQFLHFFE